MIIDTFVAIDIAKGFAINKPQKRLGRSIFKKKLVSEFQNGTKWIISV